MDIATKHAMRKIEIMKSQMEGKKPRGDRQAYISLKRLSFCALRAWWKRQFVIEIMSQLTMNEALEMDTSHVKPTWPPATKLA